VPTLGQFLPGYEPSAWTAVGAPRNTPAEIVEKLNNEINANLDAPEIKGRLADLGAMTFAGSPADFGKFITGQGDPSRQHQSRMTLSGPDIPYRFDLRTTGDDRAWQQARLSLRPRGCRSCSGSRLNCRPITHDNRPSR
jgi:hypothetical protein